MTCKELGGPCDQTLLLITKSVLILPPGVITAEGAPFFRTLQGQDPRTYCCIEGRNIDTLLPTLCKKSAKGWGTPLSGDPRVCHPCFLPTQTEYSFIP
jgi:hypothetical protein